MFVFSINIIRVVTRNIKQGFVVVETEGDKGAISNQKCTYVKFKNGQFVTQKMFRSLLSRRVNESNYSDITHTLIYLNIEF